MNNPQFNQVKISLLKTLILTLFLMTMRWLIPHPIIIIASWVSAFVCLIYFGILVWLYHYR
ncbi:hypothetical protein [Latilactobacillus fuchuensis]|uniref:Uncharacterized protein n=2 Tax=Latilactobacillus fuchuensis TaxID=164393 RepID=A0A2N9DW35_9LACO|nr:hypothetical protein [Latilactobacillus fuchuensis]KRL59424.1 hypothetical protein FC69_GL001677 [Latilactobacillus fuchuensis DSM 14340 = JCM 11249]MCP8858357.1 hypothetical protein [Latilactobacillus fuchuensis]SPC38782.1 conserved hypothetical protein [Latilactobacillus fuchuensis]